MIKPTREELLTLIRDSKNQTSLVQEVMLKSNMPACHKYMSRKAIDECLRLFQECFPRGYTVEKNLDPIADIIIQELSK